MHAKHVSKIDFNRMDWKNEWIYSNETNDIDQSFRDENNMKHLSSFNHFLVINSSLLIKISFRKLHQSNYYNNSLILDYT